MAFVKWPDDAFAVKNKKSSAESVAIAQTPVFPQTLHRLRPNPEAATPKTKKPDNTFSQSRDTRENRGTREMKTKNNPQTLFRTSALL
jgi:hypothetical protein